MEHSLLADPYLIVIKYFPSILRSFYKPQYVQLQQIFVIMLQTLGLVCHSIYEAGFTSRQASNIFGNNKKK